VFIILFLLALRLLTVDSVIGIFGAYQNRTAEANDGYWEEVPWLMINDIEILMYALGASISGSLAIS
jgi:hypothetical protein